MWPAAGRTVQLMPPYPVFLLTPTRTDRHCATGAIGLWRRQGCRPFSSAYNWPNVVVAGLFGDAGRYSPARFEIFNAVAVVKKPTLAQIKTPQAISTNTRITGQSRRVAILVRS